MKNSNLNLQELLESKFHDLNVYFQPPENVRLDYPCIVYSLSNIQTKAANNSNNYVATYQYKVTIITKNPDNNYVDTMLAIPRVSFNSAFIQDNLYQYAFTIAYKNEN